MLSILLNESLTAVTVRRLYAFNALERIIDSNDCQKVVCFQCFLTNH